MNDTKTHAELVASDPAGLRFPEDMFITPDGTCSQTSWFGGARYVRADLVPGEPEHKEAGK